MTVPEPSPNMNDNKHNASIKRYAWTFVFSWTLLLFVSAFFTVRNDKESLRMLAESEARTAINRDIVYRSWGSSHGGVYAPITDKNQPNKYLSNIPERDITTPSGRALTLINPAYMTRQVYQLAKESGSSAATAHLTSLNPIRPENFPDPWERKALESLKSGGEEISEMLEIDGKPFIRFMRVFITEKSCLKCHAVQGYKIGDIRGGLCVTLPVQPLAEATRSQLYSDLTTHGAIWFLGVMLSGFATRRFLLGSKLQKEAEDALLKSFSLLNATLESTADGVLVTDRNGHIARWNKKFMDLWHIPEELMNTHTKYPVTNHIKAQVINPDEFFEKVMYLYNNPDESSYDTLSLVDGRYFKRFSQPQRLDNSVVGRVWSFSDITEQKRSEKALEESNSKLEALSNTDGLTGIANRRHFDELLAREYLRHIRSGIRLSLILLDIDHFKAFNDNYGHVEGDECLKKVARVLAESTGRSVDIAARYGGEEFACILPETDIDGAVLMAEKIRIGIQALNIPHKGSNVSEYVTASLGVVSVICTKSETVSEILMRVDNLLYQAKSSGRNRVESAAA
ncbi:MAG: diguanylate cyclase [Desulfuromonadaceae bacterium]|nr:diguanylate cyclase [Desulfuromonadaceae bacterium]MDD2854008.1 diguanylate cyclase [Desulfuromonadaceae bacterium]